MSLLEIQIRLDGFLDAVAIFGRRRARDASRNAEDQRVGRDQHAFATHGAGADDRARANMNMIEQHRAHRNQAIVVDRRAVNDGAMTDGDAPADRGRDAVVGVDDRAVLDVAVITDDDLVGVAADNGGGPDGHARSEGDIAEDDGGGVDESGRVDFGHVGFGRSAS